MDKEAVAARVKLSRGAILKLLLFAAVAWLVFGLISFFLPPALRWLAPTLAASIEPGTFGDMFGAGNAFFSALAFGAVAYTLWLQTQELEEARSERREAREDSKENIKLQGEIAQSQRAAAEMQFKVAQSGDVYAAYARVAGSEFVERMQRLRWLAEAAKTMAAEGVPFHIENFIVPGDLNRVMFYVQGSEPPEAYKQVFAKLDSPAHPEWKYGPSSDQVAEDAKYCVTAVVDLRPAIQLGLLGKHELVDVLGSQDCTMLAGYARGMLRFYRDEPRIIEDLSEMLRSEAHDLPTTPSRSTPN